MPIGHSGRVWEPENELLTDNSLLCTLHQTREIEGGQDGQVRKRERIAPTTLLHYLDFKDIVLLREKKRRCVYLWWWVWYPPLWVSPHQWEQQWESNRTYSHSASRNLHGEIFFFQRNYSVIYLFAATRWIFFFLPMPLKLMRSLFSWIMSNNLCLPVWYYVVVAVDFRSKRTKFILSVF